MPHEPEDEPTLRQALMFSVLVLGLTALLYLLILWLPEMWLSQ